MDYNYIRKVYAHVLNRDSCITKNELLYVYCHVIERDTLLYTIIQLIIQKILKKISYNNFNITRS